MRRDRDLPRRSFRSRISARAVLITIGLTVFVVVVFGRALAQFYVDALWYDSLGRGDVFWGQLRAKVTLFVIFFGAFVALAGINLYAADRAAPRSFPANVHPYVERFHDVFGHRLRFIRYGTAFFLAFMLALPAASQWRDWLLFRNSKSFGVRDPQFGVDAGFYVFELPFISFTIDWLFAALLIVLVLTMAAHLLNGGVIFTSSSPTVRPATKAHLAVLLAVLSAVKAADYWITRYELTNETRGFVQGATYTVVKAQIPALMLLVLVALLTSGLFLWTIRTDRWRVPFVASGLWLVVLIAGGLVYPSLVQSLIVRPNQEEREAPYIAYNVAATRAAMGIDEVVTREVSFQRLTTAEVESDIEPLQNVRLLNPSIMLSRFTADRGEVAGLKIDDLDIDRQVLRDRREQVLVAARELDLENIPNQSWQGSHLVSTRGCGLVIAPVSEVTAEDRPAYISPPLDRPELYFSPAMSGYAIARTDVDETPCFDTGEYEATSGVAMGGFARRAAFALAFLDYNVLGSGAINSDSQMLWVRSVEDRVARLAPFLDYDGDPYPVVVDGTVQWIIDAYTSTANFPYAQRIGSVQLSRSTGLSGDSNYIRNSVKAVVDAYTGDVTFYVVDPDDPIVRAWQSAFPDLFTPLEEMPEVLREHLRYPEDLFRVQTDLYSKYQIPPEDFFQRVDAWSVSQAPSTEPGGSLGTGTGGSTTPSQQEESPSEFATESSTGRFVPYYTLFRNPDGELEFVILRPFVPFSRNDERSQLQAYMTASSDSGSYGELVAYEVTNDPLPNGPIRVVSSAESEQSISREITFQDNEESGTSVVFGDLQVVPVANGLIYARPFYVEVNNAAEYRYVIVSHNDNAAMACDLSTALRGLFPGFDAEIGDRVDDDGDVLPPGSCGRIASIDAELDGAGSDSEPTTDTSDDATGGATGDLGDAGVEELLAEAERLFGEADTRLREGDLGGYQELMEQGAERVMQAHELLTESATD